MAQKAEALGYDLFDREATAVMPSRHWLGSAPNQHDPVGNRYLPISKGIPTAMAMAALTMDHLLLTHDFGLSVSGHKSLRAGTAAPSPNHWRAHESTFP